LGPAVGGYAGEEGGAPLRPDEDLRPAAPRPPFELRDDAADLLVLAVIADPERKVELRRHDGHAVDNVCLGPV
jgi:hypothetical protein